MISTIPASSDAKTQMRLDMIRPLFGPEVAVAATDPLCDLPAPFPEEAASLSARAVDKRRREFAAGRAAAHQAMRSLGLDPRPVLVSETRAPVWPAGLIGSITHTQSCAMAAVVPAGALDAIGIDVEEDTPLKPDLVPAICSARERDWLAEQENSGQMAKVIFSAKEAAYKCQYSLSGRYFGFDGMELEIDTARPAQGRFIARFTTDQGPFRKGATIEGAYIIGRGVIFTMASLGA